MKTISNSFTVVAEEGMARTGVLRTAHGILETPCFVGAATRAAVKGVTAKQMHELGAQAVLANTYHLTLAPGSGLVAEAGGLAKFMGWEGVTFTDSGGFQIMSLPDTKVSDEGVSFKSHINGDKLEMSPESSMQAQWEIGADVHMAFDCPVGYGEKQVDYATAREAMARTHTWAERSLDEHKRLAEGASDEATAGVPYQALFGVVQGGDFEDLRKESAEFFAGREFDGYGIGGMYDAGKGEKLLRVVNEILPVDRPRHWLGMGAEPRDLFVGAECGIDTFDCVAPTRQGRNGTIYTRDGRVNLNNSAFAHDFRPLDEWCDCECCRGGYTRAYLHHLLKVDEMVGKTLCSIHNERFVVKICEEIRRAIVRGNLQEFKEEFLNQYYAE